MDKYLSKKLRIISFIAILMVVYWHSYNLNIVLKFMNNQVNSAPSLDLNSFLQKFISHGIAAISVPLFFIISGYLFFYKLKPSAETFLVKYKKRSLTLVIPYLLWSAWGLLFFFILQNIPSLSIFFNSDPIRNYSITQLLYKWLWDPIPYQLWFIRDLIIYVIISPLIYILVSRIAFIILPILFLLWFLGFKLLILNSVGILFFALGAYLAIHNIKTIKISPKLKILLLLLWFTMLLVTTYLFFTTMSEITSYIYKLNILLGILAIWYSYDIFFDDISENSLVFKLSFYTFFIYAAHEPILIIIKKLLFKFIGHIEHSNLLVYLIAPIVTIILVTFISYLIKKFSPKFYMLITGNR